MVSYGRIIPFISLDSTSSYTFLSQFFFNHNHSFVFSPPIISFPLAQTPLNYIVVFFFFFFLFTARLFKKEIYPHCLHIPYVGSLPTQIEVVQAKVTSYLLGVKSNAVFLSIFFFKLYFFLCLFFIVLGLPRCMGFCLVAVCRLLIAVDSSVAQHRLLGTWASLVVAPRL